MSCKTYWQLYRPGVGTKSTTRRKKTTEKTYPWTQDNGKYIPIIINCSCIAQSQAHYYNYVSCTYLTTMFECILFGYLCFSANCFSIAQLTVGLSIIGHHLYPDVFIIILHLILESRHALGIYTFRNILFKHYRYHSNVIFIFLCFQKLNRRKAALPTVPWSPSIRAKFAEVLTSEEDPDPTHPQRKRTVIPLAWKSPELRMLKQQLDDHETTLSIAKGKGVRQPVDRDQPDRLSDLPKPENAPAWACT